MVPSPAETSQEQMHRFVYQWRVNQDHFLLRAVVGPVTDEIARSVDRVIDEEELDTVLQELDGACAPPWCAHGVVEAPDWPTAADRVRAWHFT